MFQVKSSANAACTSFYLSPSSLWHTCVSCLVHHTTLPKDWLAPIIHTGNDSTVWFPALCQLCWCCLQVFGIVALQLAFTVGIACVFLFNNTLKVRWPINTSSGSPVTSVGHCQPAVGRASCCTQHGHTQRSIQQQQQQQNDSLNSRRKALSSSYDSFIGMQAPSGSSRVLCNPCYVPATAHSVSAPLRLLPCPCCCPSCTPYPTLSVLQLYVRRNNWVFWTAWGLAIAMLLVISCVEKARRSFPTNMILLAAFTAVQAFLVGTLTAFYNIEAVAIAFAVTSAAVVAITIFAINTKIDVTRWGTLLLVALVAFIGLLIIGMFWVNKVLYLVLSGIACLLFSAYLVSEEADFAAGTQVLHGSRSPRRALSFLELQARPTVACMLLS